MLRLVSTCSAFALRPRLRGAPEGSAGRASPQDGRAAAWFAASPAGSSTARPLLPAAAPAAGLGHSTSYGTLLQLTDTSVPEEGDAELQAAEAAAGAAAAPTDAGARAAGGEGAGPADGAPAGGEEQQDAWAAPPSPTLQSGRQLWADFFSVTPATAEAGPSTSLDFIAP